MQTVIMSLLVFSAGLFDIIANSNANLSIPTQVEQANLLTNVQEIFEQLKLLVNDEEKSTNESVVNDINRIVRRALDKLLLVEELSLIKLSFSSNSVCMLDSRPIIQNLVHEASETLNYCKKRASEDILVSSSHLTNITETATEKGQDLLDSLSECSRKSGLRVISCYRSIIATDVVPVKTMLLGVIHTHRQQHLRAIEIRKEASDCIDFIMDKYQIQIAQVLTDAIKCM